MCPGVLQRIAVVYLLTAMLLLHANRPTRVVVTLLLLLVHWATLTLVPFDGHASGMVSPDQNLHAFIDRLLFGRHRLTPLDPEGALGTLSATAVALLGTLAGDWLRAAERDLRRVTGLAIGGTAVLAIGLVWSPWLALNKP